VEFKYGMVQKYDLNTKQTGGLHAVAGGGVHPGQRRTFGAVGLLQRLLYDYVGAHRECMAIK
jgi:hypothetical protein